nr:hypothetical protein [Treponema sp.]
MNKNVFKKITAILFCSLLSLTMFAQSNNTVDISDEIYTLLKNAEVQNLCDTLSTIRPYTQKYIAGQLNKILENLENSNDKKSSIMREVVEEQLKRFEKQDGLSLKDFTYKISDQKASIPVSLIIDTYNDSFFSQGIYSDSKNNSLGYEITQNFNIYGDLGNSISYRSQATLDLTKMNLKELGNYDIGWWWYDDYGVPKEDFSREEHFSDRTIKTYRNYAVLPYSYKKKWDGSIYYAKGGMNSAGLKGWPFELAGGFAFQGEIKGSFFDDLINFGIGRYNREWAAMDTGSSLVLNQNARPFFGIDSSVKPFDWLSLSMLTGFLEFPNQNHINDKAWFTTDGHGNITSYKIDKNGNKYNILKDSYFFHNLFSMAEIDFDLKNIHFDFGSTVVYPNRFELGYSFPLINRLFYQNNVGDYDNIAIYSNLKFQYPGIGYIWGSVYIDEINALFTDIFHNTRCMFAYQGGAKLNIPWIPFASLSTRYTKIEPYCYTHEALDPEINQPYYPHYICENYTNNGECLGYYLPPNSDELYVKFNTTPLASTTFGLSYQLIRHGVDWGSESDIYSGSSLYSELPAGTYGPGRSNLHKYFLKDGVYEWMNIVGFDASYNFKHFGIPVQIYSSVGYVHNWFTSI